jgi:hypothetical protein
MKGSAITGPVAKECADLWPKIASTAGSIVWDILFLTIWKDYTIKILYLLYFISGFLISFFIINYFIYSHCKYKAQICYWKFTIFLQNIIFQIHL